MSAESMVELDIGSFGFRRTHGYFGDVWGNLSGFVEIINMGADGFKYFKDTEPASGFLNFADDRQTGFEKNDLSMKLKYTLDRGDQYQHWIIKVATATESSNESYFGVSKEDFVTDPYLRYAASALDHLETQHHQASIEHLWDNEDGVRVVTTAYNHYFWRDWQKFAQMGTFGGQEEQPMTKKILFNPEGFEIDWLKMFKGEMDTYDEWIWFAANERVFRSQGVQSKIKVAIDHDNMTQDIELGIRIHQDFVQKDQVWTGYDMRGGILVKKSNAYTLIQADDYNQAQSTAIYAVDKIQRGQLTLTPGLRYEAIKTVHIPEGGVNFPQFITKQRMRADNLLSPGMGFHYRLNDELALLGGVHKGYTTVSPQESEANVEESINYESGWRFQKSGLVFDGIMFLSDYQNIKGSCTQSSGCDSSDLGRDFDGGAAVVYGIENTIGYTHGLGAARYLRTNLNQTFTKAFFNNRFQSTSGVWGAGQVEVGDPLPYIPQYQGTLLLAGGSSMWEIAVLAKHVGKVYDQTVAIATTPSTGGVLPRQSIAAFTIGDLSAHYFLNEYWQMRFSVDNITAKAYEISLAPFGSRPGKARSITLGLKARI